MKWKHCLILEMLIELGVMAWIYFFPSDDIGGDLTKAMFGFVLLYCIEVVRKEDDE